MADLRDYSGKFRSKLKLTDFDKEALIRLWHVSGKNYAGRVGHWYRFLRERFDERTAHDIAWAIWMDTSRALNTETRRVAEAMNIQDRNVAGFLKFLQWDPAQQGIIDTHCELVDNNPYHGIATIRRCWVVDSAEVKEPSFLLDICDSCLYGYEECARWYNPYIKTVCFKLPPRRSKEDICCQWEFFVPGKVERVEVASWQKYCGPELKDYSGQFLSGMNTDETAKNFSKETFARVIEAGGMLYTGIDGMYIAACQAKWGGEIAFKLDAELWRQTVGTDVSRVRRALNIQGEDVEALFKCYQFMPGIIGKMPEVEYSLKSKNEGILTVRRCRSLNYCVKHGWSALQRHLCEVVDVEGFQNTARMVNPDIKATPLKLPKHLRICEDLWKEEKITRPDRCKAVAKQLRNDSDLPGLSPIACQWAFKLEA